MYLLYIAMTILMIVCMIAVVAKIEDTADNIGKETTNRELNLEEMQRVYRMSSSMVSLGSNYDICDNLNNNCNHVIHLAEEYDLKIEPNSRIMRLTALLKQIYDSNVLSTASKEDSAELVMEINQTLYTLDTEWQNLASKTDKIANAIQKGMDQKNLLAGNIDAMSNQAKIRYYERLSKKLNQTDHENKD